MTETDVHTYRRLLDEALGANNSFQITRLDKLCRMLVPLIPEPTAEFGREAAAFLKSLRANRSYDQIQAMGEAYIKAGYITPRIWTVYGQALVDRGNQVAAASLMTSLLVDKQDMEVREELSEIYGIRGRAWKDIGYEALNEGRRGTAASALRRAYESYGLGLKTSPKSLHMLCWHGTQQVAIAHLARVNGLDIGAPDNLGRLARKILKMVEAEVSRNQVTDPWFLTAGGEMSVAFNDFAGASRWYDLVFANPRTDIFTLASTHRQLSQIWKISKDVSGATLEARLLAQIAERRGGFLLSKGEAKTLQAKLGNNDAVGMTALQEAIASAGSVAMIMRQFQPVGTGFVVEAASLGLDDVGKVVVTNAHVVSEPPEHDAALPKDVQVKFQLLDKGVHRIKRILGSLPVGEHDCSVLELDDPIPNKIRALTIADLPAVLPDDPTACVIGHPQGREVSFSFLDGELVGFEPFAGARPQRLHYRSPTDFGNSGSPVFNRNWQVVGIHRAFNPFAPALNGKAGTYAANEGISMTSIKAAFAQRNAK